MLHTPAYNKYDYCKGEKQQTIKKNKKLIVVRLSLMTSGCILQHGAGIANIITKLSRKNILGVGLRKESKPVQHY